MSDKKHFDIKEYEPGDENDLIRVFNEVFIEEIGSLHPVMSKSDWLWKFADSPLGFKTLVAINDNQEIVGQLAMQKNHFKYGNNYSVVYSIVDLCLKREYRSHNFVQRCYDKFLSKMDNIIIGFPSEAWAHAYPTIDPRTKVYHVPIFGKVLPKERVSISENLKVEQIKQIGPTIKKDLDELWQQKEKEINIGCVRNADYLNWRFLKNPNPSTLYLVKKSNEPIGYFALDQKGAIILVNDILILNNYLSTSLEALTKTASNLQGTETRLMTTDRALQNALRKKGFKEYAREEINEKGYFASRNPKEEALDNYYLTWADSDWYLHH